MTRFNNTRTILLCLAVAILPGIGKSALAQEEAAIEAPLGAAADTGFPIEAGRTLIIATKAAPPFAMRDANNDWSGISIALWESVADELRLNYRFEEASLVDMVDGVADGRFDASIAATTITPAREISVDFSHPFYTTGFSIVVRHNQGSWLDSARKLVSPDFFKAIGLLALLLSFVGLCFWLAERRRNAEEFRGGLTGIGDGFWFSAVTMTTTGYGDMAPRTLAGRLVGLVWMFTALIITSTFTGMIASALTAERLALVIEGPQDLPDAPVGSVPDSAGDAWLTDHGIKFIPFPDSAAGLDAVAAGKIDAFVYDRALLSYLLNNPDRQSLQLVPGSFGRQDYGIALPTGSALREPVNRALLRHLDTDEWRATLTRYLGQNL